MAIDSKHVLNARDRSTLRTVPCAKLPATFYSLSFYN